MAVKSQFRIDINIACVLAGVNVKVNRVSYNDKYRSGTRRIKLCGVHSTIAQREMIKQHLLQKNYVGVDVGSTHTTPGTRQHYNDPSNYHRGLTIRLPV